MRIAIGLLAVLGWAQAVQAETPVERGRYIVDVIGACGNCHTPQGPDGPDKSRYLSGGPPIKQPGFAAHPPNITQDKETGIGTWSDAEIIRAIREGIRPDGRVLGPPMPFVLYRSISDKDMAAIVAYLRTVKPLSNKAEPSTYEFPLPPQWGPPVDSVPEPDQADRVAYGAYLAGPLGHCMECHSTPGADGVPNLDKGLGAGGFPIHGPWGVAVSRNITPAGLGDASDAQIRRMITAGIRADGSKMMPPMGYGYYANLKDDDLDAIIAYLRSLPPK